MKNEEYTIRPIAHIESDLPTKFGLPRQSGLVPQLRSRIVFLPPYREAAAFRGIEGFSHLWLVWGFSAVEHYAWSPTVKPPRLGGNTKMGVFATRSPFRPNGLGLSAVKLEGAAQEEGLGTVLYVSGADLMDGTPIYDVKPYLPYTDSRPGASGGFAEAVFDHALEVDDPLGLLDALPADKREALRGLLAQDPRPAYIDDPARRYGFNYLDLDVRFTVAGGTLTVREIVKL